MRTSSASPPIALLAMSYVVLASSFLVRMEPAPTDLLFILLLGVAALYGGVLVPRGLPFTIVLGVGLFCLGNGLSLMVGMRPMSGLRYLLISVYMLLIFLVYAGLVGRFGTRMVYTVLRGFCHAALAAALLGVLARLGLIPNAEVFLDRYGMRVRSAFKDPNVFGPFVVTAIMIVLNDYLTTRRGVLNAIGYGVLFIAAVVFAFSRGAILHLGVSIAVYTLCTLLVIRRPVMSKRLMVGLLVSGVIAVLPIPYLLAFSGLGDFFTERLMVQGYDTERFAMQDEALRIAIERPFGIGPGEFVFGQFTNDPHNVYLRVFVENGLIGVVGWIMFGATCMWITLGGVLRRGPHAPTYAACLAILVGVAVESLFIDSLHWRHMFFIMSMPVGMAIAEAKGILTVEPAAEDRPVGAVDRYLV